MVADWWVVLVLTAASIVLALWIRVRRSAVGLPLVDTPSLELAARRTARIRRALALGIAGLVAAVAVLAHRPPDVLSTLLPEGERTVVVLDVSSSVGDLVFREIANTLRGVVDTAGSSGRVGLVLFSDVAQEALPPGTRAAALLPFIRFFEPLRERGVPARGQIYRFTSPGAPPATRYPLNPWFGHFSGGTQISTGLAAARQALERDAGGAGRILLVSDLAEAKEDAPRLTAELVRFSADPNIDLRVIALPPATNGEMEIFRRLPGGQELVVAAEDLERRTGFEVSSSSAFPVSMILLVGALALALATNELAVTPLAWRAPRTRVSAS